MHSVLCIGGIDPSGGAGLAADLRSVYEVGLDARLVVTAIVPQTSDKVLALHPIDKARIEEQLDSAFMDSNVESVKLGMLYSDSISRVVASKISGKPNIVADTILNAGTGDALSIPQLVDSLKSDIFPIAHLITPNVPEAEVFLGKRITSLKDMKSAAKELHELGAENVLLKGGHLTGKQVYDVLYHEGEVIVFKSRRKRKGMHGSGCSLASYIAARLASGDMLYSAVESARSYVLELMEGGQGAACQEVWAAGRTLELLLSPPYIPEVGINIAHAPEKARHPEEVCGLTGRIINVGGRPRMTGHAKIGGSRHVATIVLAAMRHDPDCRAAVNIRYSEENVAACKRAGLSIASFDRADEPEGMSSMEWGTDRAIKGFGSVPDIVYDTGGIGKEPMIRVLGNNPDQLLEKISRMLSA